MGVLMATLDIAVRFIFSTNRPKAWCGLVARSCERNEQFSRIFRRKDYPKDHFYPWGLIAVLTSASVKLVGKCPMDESIDTKVPGLVADSW